MSESPIAEFQKIRLAYDEGQNGEHLPATRGHFSEGFYKRVTASLRLTPGVVQHVVAMIHSTGTAGERVGGSKDAPLPFNVGAFNDANEMYSRLVYFAILFAKNLNRQAPGPAKRAWSNMSGKVIGLPADISPDNARYLVGIMATWLEVNLEDILGTNDLDAIMFMHDDMAKDVFRLNAKWPQSQKPFYSHIPCPSDAGKIVVKPPRFFEGDTTYSCEMCNRSFTGAEHEFYGKLFVETSLAEVVTSERTRNHLRKKYA